MTDYIINYIKGEFSEGNDVVESLKQLRYIKPDDWYPKLQFSENMNETICGEKEFMMSYKALLDSAVKHIKTYEVN